MPSDKYTNRFEQPMKLSKKSYITCFQREKTSFVVTG